MKNDKEHLNIDLDFLDRKETAHITPAKTPPSDSAGSHTPPPARPTTPVSTGYKYKWKNILIIAGIVLFFGWAVFADSGSSSSGSTYTPTSSNLLSDGGRTYECSDYNYDRAVALRPSESLGAQIANESDLLDLQIAANKAEGDYLESAYVDEYDQYAVDNYNYRVERYNTERQRLIRAINSWELRSKGLDASIDVYNNFLDTNCTPK